MKKQGLFVIWLKSESNYTNNSINTMKVLYD